MRPSDRCGQPGQCLRDGFYMLREFPVTPLAFQTTTRTPLLRLRNEVQSHRHRSGLLHYLGGNGYYSSDYGFGIAVDAAGNAYMTGMTSSSDFRRRPMPFSPSWPRPRGTLS